MSSTAIPTSRTAIRTPPVATRLPWYVTAAVVAATSAKVGVMWDISWHRSIGRDTFWTPAHLAIYLGGVLAGAACGRSRDGPASKTCRGDRKGTRLNSSHRTISYAVLCL